MNRRLRVRTRAAFLVIGPALFLICNLLLGASFWKASLGAVVTLVVLIVYYHVLNATVYKKP